MARDSYVTINKQALRHNLQRVRDLAPQSKVLAMVKGNAYGHGMVEVAQTLATADALGVAFLQEALLLRKAGIQQPIILLEGFLSEDELPLILEHNLGIVIHAVWQIQALKQIPLQPDLTVWLKVDTGMHRTGFLPQDFLAAWQEVYTYLKKPPLIMTHFARADEISEPMTLAQLNCFKELTQDLPGERSLANSAGIVAWPQSHADWVRPGIMLYGASPVVHLSAQELNLAPVMSLSAKLIATKYLSKGETIGYGARWTCPEDMPIGVVALGYGDGYPRCVAPGTPVLIHNRRCLIVGIVSMDMITVDLRPAPEAKINDSVILWGEALSVDEIAKCAGTISYELLTHINANQRLIFRYL